MTKDEAFARLAKSAFRSRFRLNDADLKYISDKGTDTIRRHAEDFVRQKLAPAEPVNDGKQTPVRGHPVFKAMHATACCCRGCLNKWYRVPLGRELTEAEQEKIVGLLTAWMEREITMCEDVNRNAPEGKE